MVSPKCWLACRVVDVDDDFGESRGFQLQEDVFQHRFPGYGNQGFRQVVGEGLQPGTESGGKNHGFHLASKIFGEGFQPGTESGGENHGFHLASKICSIFCSRWMSCTFTPNFRLMCSATCWAE